jgi:protein phosphatase
MAIAVVLLVLVVLAGLAVGREIVRSNYYVTEHDGTVSIMRGVQGSFLGLALQEPYLLGCLNARNELSLIDPDQPRDNRECRLFGVNDMRPSERAQVVAGLPSGSLDDAIAQIQELAHSSVLPTCAARTPTTTTTTVTPHLPETPENPGIPESGSETPAPETPTTVTAPAPAPEPPAPASPGAPPPAAPPPSPAPTPQPTVTALPPPPPEPGTNCREVS